MLFSVKKSAALTLAAALVFASVSLLLKHLLGLDWNTHIGEEAVRQFLTGLGLILASDLVISLILVAAFRAAYVRIFMELAEYFSPQRLYTVLAGGLLAAGEEMFFRGVLLQYTTQTLDWDSYFAVAVSAAAFALCHITRNRCLALFSLWAFWEGIVLGAVYLYTRSLPVTMAVHAAHDVAGFSLFFLQRKRGFLPIKRR